MVITLKYALTIVLVLTPVYLLTVSVEDIVAHDHTQRQALLALLRMEIGPSQRPLSDNVQHSQETASLPPGGFKAAIPATERL
jgi:hypothetical protein